MWFELPVFLYIIFSILLLPYGYNCLILTYGALKYRQPIHKPLKNYPYVTIQLPVYNESHVVERLLKSVASIDWPRDQLDIMILDDSNDETCEIIDNMVDILKPTAPPIQVLRRKSREGYKAGALSVALPKTKGKYMVIFDADFVPQPGFLKETIPYLEVEDQVGFVQTRWSHLNRHQNRFTEAFSIALDAHHIVDQAGRYQLGLLMSFTGSAGIIRTSAIKSIGGWRSDTVSEDLDLSYMLQLAGWRGVYLRDTLTFGLVPSSIADFRIQQSRWAKGSTQCARKHLGNVWRCDGLSLFQKIQASLQLTNYSISLLMLMLVISETLMIGIDFLVKPDLILSEYFMQVLLDPRLGTLFTVCTICTTIYYYTTLRTQGLKLLDEALALGLLALIGHGLSAICGISILEGLFTWGGVFDRVPKYSLSSKLSKIKHRAESTSLKHKGIETTLAVFLALSLYFAYQTNLLPATFYLLVYFAGYFTISRNL